MALSKNRLAFIEASHGIAVREGLCADRTLAEKPQTPRDAIALLARGDPTCDQKDKPGRYLTWLAQRYQQEWKAAQKAGRDHAMLFEDFERIKGYLADFDAKKHKLPAEKRDLYKLDYDGLKETVIGLRGRQQDIAATPEIMDQSTILYNGPEGMAVVPHSTAASNYWGQHTQWCTAATESNNMFQKYNRDGALVILRTDKGEKYQGHRDSALMNAQDKRVEKNPPDLQALLEALPSKVKSLFQNEENSAQEPEVDYFTLLKENLSLRSDRDFMLKAVRQDGYILRYADPTLQADREIALEAVRQDVLAFPYAAECLRADPAFILEAVRKNGEVFYYVDQIYYNDPTFILEVVKANISAITFISSVLTKRIPLAARQEGFWSGLETNWKTISYLGDVDLSLSPAQELAIFERGMADSKNKLDTHHLHLFPSLRKDGLFAGATIEDAHQHLQKTAAAASPPPPAEQITRRLPMI